MSKVVIIYASIHHRNTEKVVNYIAPIIGAEVIDIIKNKEPDISAYDTVIIASGIYFNTIHKSLINYINKVSFKDKRVILFYTCGMRYRDHGKAGRKLLVEREADYMGDVYCRGYDTFGILSKIGGIAKGHPSDGDRQRVLNKIQRLL